jgi:GntR family transcriptional regulator / MocR family aminotransferase
VWLQLDGDGPLFRQLYRALRQAILTGVVPAGSRVPATRALAIELGVSRTTVLLAYEQLAAEGYLDGRQGSGSYVQVVAAAVPGRARPAGPTSGRGVTTAPTALAPPPAPAAPRLSPFGAFLVDRRSRPIFSSYISGRPRLPYDFRYGAPSLQDFPVQIWQRCLGRRARRASGAFYDYGHPQGSPALRAALAGYLLRGRGVRCDPDQILVVSGSQQGLDLTARLLLAPGDVAAVEEPGYEGARRAFLGAGARLALIPVDADGLDVARLEREGRRARIAHVTPSHQYPLGGVMPYPRRVALLSWAARVGAYLVEDDYDGEYRFEGRPLAALKALDDAARVIYVGTLSKVMFPALRIGYLVLPSPLVEPFARAKLLADGGSAFLEQEALADFIASGAFERHIRRSRRWNGERRAVLLRALDEHLGAAATVAGANAGLHVVAWLRDVPARRARDLVTRAAARGVGVYPVTPYYESPPARLGLLLGYGALMPRSIATGVARLAEAVHEL